MNNIVNLFTKNTLSVITMTIISGITLITSTAGIMKVVGSVAGSTNSFNPKVPEVKTVATALEEEQKELTQSPTKTPTKSPTTTLTPIPTPKTTTSYLTSNTNTSTSTTNPNACIITLFGQQYDVTTLQSTHSGGNVFVCSTDQTALYQSKHGTNLSRMQPYLVGNTPGVTPTISPKKSPPSESTIEVDDDTEKEEEHEDDDDKKPYESTDDRD